MGLFNRRARNDSLLPSDMAQRLALYIDFEMNPQAASPTMATKLTDLIYMPLHPIASSNPGRFMKELAEIALPVGGRIVHGAERLCTDLIADDVQQDPSYLAMLDAALDWLRTQGFGPERLTGYEHARWIAVHGQGKW